MKRIAAVIMACVLIFLAAGCTTNTYLYKSRDEDWSFKVPKEFVKEKEDYNEEYKFYTVTFKTENESYLVINEMIDENLVINEEKLKEEIAEGNYLHVQRYETLDIKGFGKAYGALIEDEAIGNSMMYYRLKHKDKAVSFIIYRRGNFSPEQIEKGKNMIASFKALK